MSAEPLNARERAGHRICLAGFSLVGAPLALLLLPSYLLAARRGLSDQHAPRTMAAVAVAMAFMPLWILLVLDLAGWPGES